ncbi:glycosyltransferase AglI [Natronococcus amylolyticus DSM 10524]|uniref:Glycosyltransferase AglI n=1 Tax=Natronococcus amylolyticus DSM 10524 TaxID=1227497 RepID=L9WYP5_9EURY|nr:glycosyltransferase [Natronococcus amylolyticus]ELY53473.1 glycosyltransferase AglI [Natronococcus amylolyticus DSM 10524]
MTTVSIITPVYNDFPGLRETVDSLAALSTEIDWEHVVVDNGSTDGTRERAERYVADQLGGTVLLEDEIQSSYAARNAGVRHSGGDVLAFVDADMTVPEGWLEDALDAFRAADADYMGCNVELEVPDGPSLAARYDHHSGFPVGHYLEHQRFAPTCCLFVRREVFADVGLFDHRLTSGGDKEFGNRVDEAGYDLHFADDVTMHHPVRDSIRALVRKDLRVGRGLCQLQRYHPDRYGTPGIPPRPSGVKQPDPGLERRERLAFGALETALTGVRGIGYYREYLARKRGRELGGIPSLAE